jgi:hypothetical protein
MIYNATSLEAARALVRQAALTEHRLYVDVCNMLGTPANGMRGFTELHSYAQCLQALQKHNEKIKQHQSVLVNSEQHLKDFNKLAQEMGIHPTHESFQPERKHGWLFRLWCWWNFRR